MAKTGKKVVKETSLRAFAQAVDRAYGNWGYLIGRSFVAGVFVALGATIGFAVVLLMLGYVLSWLGLLPVVGEFFSRLNEFISTATPM